MDFLPLFFLFSSSSFPFPFSFALWFDFCENLCGNASIHSAKVNFTHCGVINAIIVHVGEVNCEGLCSQVFKCLHKPRHNFSLLRADEQIIVFFWNVQSEKVVWQARQTDTAQEFEGNMALATIVSRIDIVNGVFGQEKDALLHLVSLVHFDNHIRENDSLITISCL